MNFRNEFPGGRHLSSRNPDKFCRVNTLRFRKAHQEKCSTTRKKGTHFGRSLRRRRSHFRSLAFPCRHSPQQPAVSRGDGPAPVPRVAPLYCDIGAPSQRSARRSVTAAHPCLRSRGALSGCSAPLVSLADTMSCLPCITTSQGTVKIIERCGAFTHVARP
eukprot:4887301-Prymnesium_polylepis.1